MYSITPCTSSFLYASKIYTTNKLGSHSENYTTHGGKMVHLVELLYTFTPLVRTLKAFCSLV